MGRGRVVAAAVAVGEREDLRVVVVQVFVYQTPVLFQLGVDAKDRISVSVPNSGAFFKYTDLNNDESEVFKFSDRNEAQSIESEWANPEVMPVVCCGPSPVALCPSARPIA